MKNGPNLVFLNGKIVAEEDAKVSVFDRAFCYGDGLFETLLVRNGRAFRWADHVRRLEEGAAFLDIRIPFSSSDLEVGSAELIRRAAVSKALLRITLSRGAGGRGYSRKGADQPLIVMSLRPAPVVDAGRPRRWSVITSSLRVAPGDSLARFKTCNKLHQIFARAEAERLGADEAILLNTDGEVTEAAASNVFWIERGAVYTPPLTSPALPGVTRAVVLDLCAELGIASKERPCPPEALKNAEGVFLTLSSQGIIEVEAIDGQLMASSGITTRLSQAYQDLLLRETGG